MSKNPVLEALRRDDTITLSIIDGGTRVRVDFHLDSVVFLKNLIAMVEMMHDEDGICGMPFTTWYVDDDGNKLLVSRGH